MTDLELCTIAASHDMRIDLNMHSINVSIIYCTCTEIYTAFRCNDKPTVQT